MELRITLGKTQEGFGKKKLNEAKKERKAERKLSNFSYIYTQKHFTS